MRKLGLIFISLLLFTSFAIAGCAQPTPAEQKPPPEEMAPKPEPPPDASKAVFASGEVSWKRSQDSTVLDSKKLLQAHPELLNQFSTIRAGSRRFLIRT